VPEAGKPYLAIIGEAPGEVEDDKGEPFTGPSGKLLNWILADVGIPRNRCYVSNVIACRPPENNIDGLEGTDAVLCCKPGLNTDLKWLSDQGVTTILALGNTAMHALGIEGAVSRYRGSVFEIPVPGRLAKMRVVPTYHPSAIMQQNWKRSSGGTADMMVLWRADMTKVKEIADGHWVDAVEDFNLEPTADDVVAFVHENLARNALFAVDTETTGLHPDYAQIVVIGLAVNASKAISVPLLTTGGEAYFKNGDWAKVQNALRELFAHGRQMYQNCFFDVPLLRKHGFHVPYENIIHDTMLIHHTIAAEAPHDLGTIVSIYGKTPFWKEEFSNRTVSILQMDQIEMRRYNLRDCVVLHQVLEPMLKDMRELNLVKLYNEEVHPLIGPIMDMTAAGIGFDPKRVAKYKRDMTAKVHETEDALYTLGNLPRSFSFDSGDHLRWFFYAVEPSAFKKLAELSKKKPGTKVYAELKELEEVRDKVRPIYLLKGWTPRTTDSDKFATNKQALLGLQIQLNNRLSDLRGQKHDTSTEETQILRLLDFIVLLSKYNLYRKLVSTYTEYHPWKDGRIHSRWIMHGTVSGRLACRDPNLTNQPKKREDDDDPRSPIRAFFVARPGYKFVSTDYVNLEAQLLAFETLDPSLCSVFEKGYNLHDLNTKSLFRIGPEDPKWHAARKAAKIFFFGGISYGGGDYEIFDKVSLEAPDLHLTFAEFKTAKDNWMTDHPAYVAWKKAIGDEVMSTRMITTEFGRKRVFLSNDKDIIKEALDFKIQSPGASLVNRAMVRIDKRVKEEHLKADFVLQIHDQLVMETPEESAARIAKIMSEELERPFMYKDHLRHIPVECEIGNDFGEV